MGIKRLSKQGQAIRSFLKLQLKLRKWTYREFAKHLMVSEISVKRWMTKQDIPLETLIRFGELLNFSVVGLINGNFQDARHFQFYTAEQESFFVANPRAALVFLKLLTRSGLETARRSVRATEGEFRGLIRSLENVGLLEHWPSDKIKMRLRGPFRWQDNGKMMSHYFPRLRDSLFHHFSKKFRKIVETPAKNDCGIFRPFEMYLHSNTAQEFSRELINLLSKYRQISAHEYGRNLTTEPIAGFIAVDRFDAWSDVFVKSAGLRR